MLLKLTLNTSLHLEVRPFSLTLTHNGQLAFLGATVISHLQKTHSAFLPWLAEEQAGWLAVLNFGMWLRGPRRSVTPHLQFKIVQYLRFLVMRTTRSLAEPFTGKGPPTQMMRWTHFGAMPRSAESDLVPVAWRLLLTNCSCNFPLQKNDREEKPTIIHKIFTSAVTFTRWQDFFVALLWETSNLTYSDTDVTSRPEPKLDRNMKEQMHSCIIVMLLIFKYNHVRTWFFQALHTYDLRKILKGHSTLYYKFLIDDT